MPERAFAGYPAPFIYDKPRGRKKIKQLIWGDHVRLLGGRTDDGWVEVTSRSAPGWMKATDLQDERLLEVSFVDIGQGDGSFIVTPDDKFMLVDAGQTDNMKRFLSWRFNLRSDPSKVIKFSSTVLSHPDQDHYKGFDALFRSEQFSFGTIYHNGIVERAGDEPLGERFDVDGVLCVETIRSHTELQRRLADPAFVGQKVYPRMLAQGLKSGRIDKLVGLSHRDKHLPGFEADKELSIQVLGPVPESGRKGSLRWFGDTGKTKNGHSVVLRLVYRDVRILLGGDLNIPSEEHLLRQHLGGDPPPASDEEAIRHYIAAARAIFEVDVSKACHHGSADFTSMFLRALNPIATVVSSGDDEPHAHPRPDALGSFGRFSRGDRPLIFSTELARSTRESMNSPEVFRQELKALFERREALLDDEVRNKTKLDAVGKQIDAQLALVERSVAVYGMINLRTDGRRVVLAQKLERPRGNGSAWDFHCLEPDNSGQLHYKSKHD